VWYLTTFQRDLRTGMQGFFPCLPRLPGTNQLRSQVEIRQRLAHSAQLVLHITEK